MLNQLGILLWFISGFFFLISTTYYIIEMFPAYLRHRKSYLNPNIPSNDEITTLLIKTNQEFPRFKFQITTKGNELDVVKRGIKSIVDVSKSIEDFRLNFELLIVTEEPTERALLQEFFHILRIDFPTKVLVVPKSYESLNSTKMKARSLQYSVEHRSRESRQEIQGNQRSFVFYFDSESTIAEKEFRRVVHSVIMQKDKRIFEGPIVYPHKYFKSNIFSRQMEASRPFNCHHCVQVMKNPPPIHLHGSNLLVEEKLLLEIGWDFGLVDKHPILAEDLIFGLKVYLNKGNTPFGWHGGQLCEQPPFTLKSSFNARTRWVTGAWQALKMIKLLPEFQSKPWRQRYEISLKIRLRTITHSLSFFAALFVPFSILIFLFPSIFNAFYIDPMITDSKFLIFQFIVARFVFLPGTILWISGVAIGALKNMEKIPNITKRAKIVELIQILLITPIAGIIESASALYASIRWIIGKPLTKWYVTEK